ncbi:MAG: copper resistance protein CopC [Actinomycetes bacterium]
MKCVRNLIASLGVVAMIFLLTPFPAHAHAELMSSSPAASSHLPILPTKIVLHFAEHLSDLAGANAVIVTDPSGVEISTGVSNVSTSSLTRELNSSTNSGAYHVDFRVLSKDGHPVAGQFDFFVHAPDVIQSFKGVDNSDASTQKSPSALHVKQLSIVLLVLLTVGIWALVEARARRRRGAM